MAEKRQHRLHRADAAARKRQRGEPIHRGPVALAERADPIVLQRAIADPGRARPAGILALQRAYGNRAVTRLLTQAPPRRTGASPARRPLIQAKLMVGPVGDRYEREADRVAGRVLTMPPLRQGDKETRGQGDSLQRQAEEEGELQMKPLAASITPLVQRQAEEEEEELQMKPLVQRQVDEEEEELQMKPLVQRQVDEEEELQMTPSLQRRADGGFEASPGLESRLATQRGSGSPLPEDVRAQMEPRFGADFGGVRVHADSEATQLNRELSAQAFTHGQDIYFRSGEYNPETPSGQKLLAHELVHTLQQGVSRRIQGWWPLGHRTITEKAIGDSKTLSKFFDEDEKAYLIKRSPDMDFLQDETTAMEKGIQESQPKIKEFNRLTFAQSPEARKEAKRMWENNELHKRPQWYMLHHGEGGFYKDDASTAAGKNRAVTDQLVELAANSYIAGNQEAGLSILSDAIHQAEDRGSHQEGEALKGHDIRQTIPRWRVRRLDNPNPGPDDYIYQSKPDPDNASNNPEGAKYALRFAHIALLRFRQKVKDVKLGEEKEERLHERHTKVFAGKKLGRITSTSSKIKTKFAGTTGEEAIKKYKPDVWKALEDVGRGGVEDDEDQQALVDKSVSEYVHAWITAELTERIRKKQKIITAKRTHEDRIATAREELDDLIKSHPELFGGEEGYFGGKIEQKHKNWWVDRAVANYEYQKAKRYAGTKPAEPLED